MNRARRAPTRLPMPARPLVLVVLVFFVAVGCVGTDSSSGTASSTADGPTIVVTTDILGDVVTAMAGDEATVDVVMPTGASPHDFQPSAKQAVAMRSADVLVTNGAGFELGLVDTIEAAEADGVTVCEATDGVDTLQTRGGTDPHFFSDPARMAAAVDHLAGCITRAVPELGGEDSERSGFLHNAAEESAELSELDAEVRETLSVVPEDRRVLVTDHEVFGYFADRYDFEVLGAIIPSVSSQSEADAAALSDLAELVQAQGVQAVFAEASSSRALAEALAAEAGDVEVVALFSESLGPDGAESYAEMMRTNARRIAGALS